MKKFVFFSILCSNILCSFVLHSQNVTSLTFGKQTFQSSTYQQSVSANAVDGSVNNSLTATTQLENNPWLDIDLGLNRMTEELRIWYAGQEMKNYYVFISDVPYSDYPLEKLLSLEKVKHIHVKESLPSGYKIPLNVEGRFIRIQRADFGRLSIIEVGAKGDDGGGGEDGTPNGGTLEKECKGGIDEGGDGFTDCNDKGCSPYIANVTVQHPTCAICPDGAIYAQVFGPSLPGQPAPMEYSLDQGSNWIPYCNNLTDCITGLLEDEYHLWFKSTITQCVTKYGLNPEQIGGQEETINLIAFRGGHDGCYNGGFEEGNFESWEVRAGKFENTTGNITWDEPFRDWNPTDQMEILPSGYIDPIIDSDILNPSLNNSIFIARFGDLSKTSDRNIFDYGDIVQAQYCFIVDADNVDFSFNFSLVLENPMDDDHSDINQPFFEWKIADKTSGDLIGGPEKHIADVTDSFFESQGGFNQLNIVYKGWTCRQVDLSEYMGREVCFEITIADCSENGHLGYVYIDNLCSEDIDAQLEVLNNDDYCRSQDIVLDVSQSTGFNQFNWDICIISVVTDDVLECKSSGFIPGHAATIHDLIDYYDFTLGGNRDVFDCDEIYITAELTLKNDCGSVEKIEIKVNYHCNFDRLRYEHISYCGSNDQDIRITSNNSCPTCTYEWEPAEYLSSDSEENPLIRGSINVLALSQTYHVTATNALGCVFEDEVRIFNTGELLGTITLREELLGWCETEIFADVVTFEPTRPSDLDAVFRWDNNNEQTFDGELVSDNELSTNHTFKLPMPISKKNAEQFSGSLSAGNRSFAFTDCSTVSSFTTAPGPWFGEIRWFNRITFSPHNDDGIHDEFGPCIPCNTGFDCAIPCSNHNIINASFRVFNKGGAMVHSADASSDFDQPFNSADLLWDGNFMGVEQPIGDYVYVMDFGNCEFVRTCLPCGNIPNCDYVDGDCTRRDADGWGNNEGDVTIFR